MGELHAPNEKDNLEFMTWFCDKKPPLAEAQEDILIWEVDSHAIGFCTLKQLKIPKYGQMHLHMWSKSVPMAVKSNKISIICPTKLFIATLMINPQNLNL